LVQLRPPGQAYPTNCETTDISLCGCYVKLLSPLPVGTVVDMRVRTGDTEVKVQGVVKTSNPGLGNGIDFLDMAPASRLQLQHYLETIPDVKAPEFIP
jgi:hypothetical protein